MSKDLNRKNGEIEINNYFSRCLFKLSKSLIFCFIIQRKYGSRDF